MLNNPALKFVTTFTKPEVVNLLFILSVANALCLYYIFFFLVWRFFAIRILSPVSVLKSPETAAAQF